MEVEKYRQLAVNISELFAEGYTHANGRLEPYEPAEFQMGLELALAMYFVAMFPRELEEVLRMHQVSLAYIVEEVEVRSGHRDDRLQLSAFDLFDAND